MLHRSGPKIEIRPTKNHDPTRDPQNLPILFLISASSSLLKGWDSPVVKNISYTFVQKLTGLSGGGVGDFHRSKYSMGPGTVQMHVQ